MGKRVPGSAPVNAVRLRVSLADHTVSLLHHDDVTSQKCEQQP